MVMSDAVVQQVGTPAEVYYDPSNLFVARFIGSPGMNLVSGNYRDGSVRLTEESAYSFPVEWQAALTTGLPESGHVIVGFRPEAAQIKADGQLVGEVYASELYGAYTMLHVMIAGGDEIVHIRSDRRGRHEIGAAVRFDLDPEMVRFFDPTTEMAIRR